MGVIWGLVGWWGNMRCGRCLFLARNFVSRSKTCSFLLNVEPPFGPHFVSVPLPVHHPLLRFVSCLLSDLRIESITSSSASRSRQVVYRCSFELHVTHQLSRTRSCSIFPTAPCTPEFSPPKPRERHSNFHYRNSSPARALSAI